MSGAYFNDAPIVSRPNAVAEALEEKPRLTGIDIHTAVSNGPAHSVKSLSLRGRTFENKAAFEVLAEQLQHMSSLEAIDFSHCSGLADNAAFHDVLRQLCGCDGLLRVGLAGCGLKASDVSFIAGEVAAWTKSVTEWDLSDNPAAGSAAILEFVAALGGSTVARLNISNTGINDARSGGALMAELMGLGHLMALGVGRNSGITVAQMGGGALAEMDEFLAANAEMSGLAAADHMSLVAALEKEEAAAKAKAKAAAPAAAEPAAKAPKAAAPAGGVVRRGASPLKQRRAESPSAQQPAAAAARPSVPSTTTIRRGASPMARTGSGAPAAAANSSRAPSGAATPRGGSAARSTRAGTPTGTARGASAVNSPARRGLNSTTGSAAATQAISQREVTDGYEHWKENKAKYNDYISFGVKKKKPEEEAAKAKPAFYTYKYAFGKSVDKVKDSGSRRANSTTITREPTAVELRTIAPWIVDRNYVSSPGRTVLVDDPTKPGFKIKFVDGGDVRAVENDPREIGYVARRREAGQLTAGRCGGFASTTPREVRFGTDPSNQIIRWAQAPGPGHYYVKSEFEVNAEKAQINAANRPAFGSRGDRISFNKVKVDPREAEKPVVIYEIP